MRQQQAQYLSVIRRNLAESNTDMEIKAIAIRSVLDYWRKMGLKGEDLLGHTSMLRLQIINSSFAENHALASRYVQRLEALWAGDMVGSLLENNVAQPARDLMTG